MAPDYFDEVADLMAGSRTVGPYVDRATILAALRAKFTTEDALREFMKLQFEAARAQVADGAALLVPPKPGETEWELLVADTNAKEH